MSPSEGEVFNGERSKPVLIVLAVDVPVKVRPPPTKKTIGEARWLKLAGGKDQGRKSNDSGTTVVAGGSKQ